MTDWPVHADWKGPIVMSFRIDRRGLCRCSCATQCDVQFHTVIERSLRTGLVEKECLGLRKEALPVRTTGVAETLLTAGRPRLPRQSSVAVDSVASHELARHIRRLHRHGRGTVARLR